MDCAIRTALAQTLETSSADALRPLLKRVWGYDGFRPLQAEAVSAILAGEDSVVVLPTGGGKSLCFQLPALAMDGMAIVVSPLISLMKDQVDALRACGVSSACINSALPFEERRAIAARIHDGSLKILYVAPERLTMDGFLDWIGRTPLSFIAVDEAHCISAWGHDFRPEYRRLSLLREAFPGLGIHAYTATATKQVREDIAQQLCLARPRVFVGSYDRPNLIYRVQRRRSDRMRQIRPIIERYPGESGVIYCLSRKDVEALAGELRGLGYKALPYHAGLDDDVRQGNQDAFIQDRADIIVATVAFGMGIDKSNVRYVIHAAMPKSLEHYQQESGRAGRDGLDAECCLLYSGSDYNTWKHLMRELEPPAQRLAQQKLSAMYDYCTSSTCRHEYLISYFGQSLAHSGCDACDVCLGDVEWVPDALTIGQKILSCVVRLKEERDAHYTILVLTGADEAELRTNGHDQLSTWGLMRKTRRADLADWIEQLVSQEFLVQDVAGRLSVTPKGWRLLRGEANPRLIARTPPEKPEKPVKPAKVADGSWEGVDRDLFDMLKVIRRQLADEREVPAYVIFSDAALRDLARRRPASRETLLLVHGVGQKKAEDYGDLFLRVIADTCAARNLGQDRF